MTKEDDSWREDLAEGLGGKRGRKGAGGKARPEEGGRCVGGYCGGERGMSPSQGADRMNVGRYESSGCAG